MQKNTHEGGLIIPPLIVREIAQSVPKPGDFREQFLNEQSEACEFIDDQLGESEISCEFAHRIAAALWAMYVRTTGESLPLLEQKHMYTLKPIASSLLEKLNQAHPNETFDAEWLIELPKGDQPHIMGFLVGALRAARFRLSGEEIFETAATLFALVGALESAAANRESSNNE